MKHTYNLYPKIKIKNNGKVLLLEKIIKEINSLKYKNIVIETYPGVRLNDLKDKILKKLNKDIELFWSEDYALQGNEFREAILDDLTEDRVFGKFTNKKYKNFFTKNIKNDTKYKLCYGIGASNLLEKADLVIYVDLTRWEIQNRYRNKEKVFFGGTLEDEKIKNFKRGYFVEWRMADKIKEKLLPKMNYYIDSTHQEWKLITKNQFFSSLNQASIKPFRLVPYFDYGVWGGNWMEKHLNLGKNKYSKWAWGFDGVPEENSIILEFDEGEIEMPAMNMVLFNSINLLGEKVWKRFGNEFPIRFDFLDTINGQNLSLQVHPTNKYIRENFKGKYTQEESYYILDINEKENPSVYLGLKTIDSKNGFINELKNAQKINEMDVEKYVNKYKAKKHDHFLHPAGVVHSSGSGCMVLEISSTPYIFTFKLWDWGRLGLDGKPRPINISHGEKVIDYSFDSKKTKEELINNFSLIEENNNYKVEKTGLHPRQFIETRRITLSQGKEIIIKNNDSVNVLNLVEGEKINIESTNLSIDNLSINFAETFIVPEACKKYKIKNQGKNSAIIIQAFVRTKE